MKTNRLYYESVGLNYEDEGMNVTNKLDTILPQVAWSGEELREMGRILGKIGLKWSYRTDN